MARPTIGRAGATIVTDSGGQWPSGRRDEPSISPPAGCLGRTAGRPRGWAARRRRRPRSPAGGGSPLPCRGRAPAPEFDRGRQGGRLVDGKADAGLPRRDRSARGAGSWSSARAGPSMRANSTTSHIALTPALAASGHGSGIPLRDEQVWQLQSRPGRGHDRLAAAAVRVMADDPATTGGPVGQCAVAGNSLAMTTRSDQGSATIIDGAGRHDSNDDLGGEPWPSREVVPMSLRRPVAIGYTCPSADGLCARRGERVRPPDLRQTGDPSRSLLGHVRPARRPDRLVPTGPMRPADRP